MTSRPPRGETGTDTVPDVAESSPYRRLVEHVLGEDDLCTYVRRRDGEGASRRAIARELSKMLSAKIGEEIEISDVSVNRWCPK